LVAWVEQDCAMAEARSVAQRKADALTMLSSKDLDAWVATSSPEGVAHLVPLSTAWDGECLLLATEPSAITTKNIVSTGRARVALGQTRDVLIVDAVLERSGPAASMGASLIDRYAAQAGWDPRDAGMPFVMLRLRPVRIQAWREVNEIADRTLMRNGRWLVD
jgi:hypothetical protein